MVSHLLDFTLRCLSPLAYHSALHHTHFKSTFSWLLDFFFGVSEYHHISAWSEHRSVTCTNIVSQKWTKIKPTFYRCFHTHFHPLIHTLLPTRPQTFTRTTTHFQPLVHTHSPKPQALVYDILPSTTAVFSHVIGSWKLWANEQFFVGAQIVVSLLQTTQIKQGVSFIAANKVYTSTNKTTIVWIETELLFLHRGGCVSSVFTWVLWREVT